MKNLLAFIIARDSLIVLLWQLLAGHTILTLYPFPKINKLTAFRTEGTDRIVFPLDWFTAGWTIHEIVTPRDRAYRIKETRVV